jgi:hypothetical protein
MLLRIHRTPVTLARQKLGTGVTIFCEFIIVHSASDIEKL